MNCNDAFDRLTTPGGLDDALLAEHLAGCARCRAMAETLAPAIELFGSPQSEAVPHGAATTIARRSAARLSRRSLGAAVSTPRRRGLSLLAAALGGASLCLAAIQLSGNGNPESGMEASCPRNSPATMEWMERNSLPVAMACVACHPAGGFPGTTSSMLRTTGSRGGAW